MVEEITLHEWECTYCNRKFRDYDSAYECASECCEIDEPEEQDNTYYICKYCGTQKDSEKKAIECEERHTPAQKLEWSQADQNMFWYDVASHPSQTELDKYL